MNRSKYSSFFVNGKRLDVHAKAHADVLLLCCITMTYFGAVDGYKN